MENQGKDLCHAIEFLRVLNRGLTLDKLAESVLNYALSQVPHAQGDNLIVLNRAEDVFEFRAAEGWDIVIEELVRV